MFFLFDYSVGCLTNFQTYDFFVFFFQCYNIRKIQNFMKIYKLLLNLQKNYEIYKNTRKFTKNYEQRSFFLPTKILNY